MASIAEQLIPVGSLVLGITLTQVLTDRGGARERRLAANDLLAENSRHIWSKGEDNAWIDLQVYLGRLQGALTAANVQPGSVRIIAEVMRRFWVSTEDDDEGGLHLTDAAVARDLDLISQTVRAQLQSSFRRRSHARRLARRTLGSD